jgi:AcrR family transcriptional regulator
LVEAGLQCFLRKGVAASSIDDLTKAAGLSKAAFYRYFDNKEALVALILAPVSESLSTCISACSKSIQTAQSIDDVRRAYQLLAASLVQAALTHPQALELYLQECRAPGEGASAPIRALGDQVVQETVALSYLASDAGWIDVPHPEVSAAVVVGAAEHLALRILRDDMSIDPALVAQTVVGVVLEGIFETKD